MILLDVEQDTPEWHEIRRVNIGGSDTPIINGVSPFKKPPKLMEEKWTGTKGYVSIAMQRGKELEPYIRQWFSETYFPIEPKVIRSSKHPWMIASLDGLSKDRRKGVEIKCTNSKTFDECLKGKIPEYYLWQNQHEIEGCGFDGFTLVISEGNPYKKDVRKPIVVDIQRDQKIIDQLVETDYDFYTRMIDGRYPEKHTCNLLERTDEDAAEIVDAAFKAKSLLDDIKEKYEIIKDGGILIANDISFRCNGITLRKKLMPGTLDYDRMISDYGIDKEKYRKTGRVQWNWEFPRSKEE